MLDLFAWIVLIVLVASTVFVGVFLAILPGMIRSGAITPGRRP